MALSGRDLRVGREARLRGNVSGIRDLEAAWTIGERFPDQDFSLVDRTSFALMERLGISRVISFDADFAVFRYGHGRKSAFEVLQ